MTQTPSDDALLAATIDYLEGQLLPALEGEHRFKTRLAVNALKALQRNRRPLAWREQAANDHSADGSAPQAKLNDNQLLALKIFKRETALDDPETLAQIERMLSESLAVNNPKWLNK
jgi:Domain of unknown function (DUF6285)